MQARSCHGRETVGTKITDFELEKGLTERIETRVTLGKREEDFEGATTRADRERK